MDGLEYRRLMPRYLAWSSQQPIIKPTIIQRLSDLFSFAKAEQKNPPIKNYFVPKDILHIIIQHLPTEGRRRWRAVSRYWHNYVDKHTDYWKNVERDIIDKDYPAPIKEVFGGAEKIRQLPFFQLTTGEIAEKFAINRPFMGPYHISFLKPEYMKESVARGITPDGHHFICFMIRNITLNSLMIMTMHETAHAWTINISPWNYDYLAPFSEEIYSKKSPLTEIVNPEFVPLMRRLLQGMRIRRAVGSIVQIQCEFVLVSPSKRRSIAEST